MDFDSLKKIFVRCKQAVCCCFMHFDFASKIFAGCKTGSIMFVHALEIQLYVANSKYDAASCTLTSQVIYLQVANRQYAYDASTCTWNSFVGCINLV